MIESIALSLIPNLSCRSIRQLISILGSPKEVFDYAPKELSSILRRHADVYESIRNRTTFQRAEQELSYCEKHHITPRFFTQEDYPQRLNLTSAEDTPPLLYTMGDADLNSKRIVSVVGTRRATEYGKELTRKLVESMREEGILVVSGLAYGIDTASHRSAVDCEIPTVGVVAHGFDQLYPPQNRELARQMITGNGGLVTEYPSFTKIHPSFFPARNRIIAAMADAVVVVEAGEKGGALITANLANGYHREVFAYPGRVGDTYSVGTNRIISCNKAALIQSADDLFEMMGWEHSNNVRKPIQQSIFAALDSNETVVYNILQQNGSLCIEEIAAKCELATSTLASTLLGMELKNICKCLPGRRYMITQ